MTSEEKREPTETLLEQILVTVQSIDRNVEELREQLGDQTEELRYQREWFGRDPTDLGTYDA